MVPDLIVAGIPAIAIIIGLVEYVKSWGLDSKWCALLAMLLGVLIGVGTHAMTVFPNIAPWIEAGVIGLVVGMAATGLYKLGSRWRSA